jgi:polyisoprenoid-binding protein YceI
MRKPLIGLAIAVVFACLLGSAALAVAAENYMIDPVHSSFYFKISHSGISSVFGRFDDCSGDFTIDPDDPAKCSFKVSIKTESIDTNNKQRDDHLRSPDFFNAKQFPTISFKSTSVKSTSGGFQVTGDFTMHGVTKPITFTLTGGKKAEFPKGAFRTGYSTELTLKRSDFDMTKFAEALGDEVTVAISFQGVKK